jgi:hypothetical protein
MAFLTIVLLHPIQGAAMSELGHAIRRAFQSFRRSVTGLFDSDITADDLRGLLWLAVVGLVVVIVMSLMRAMDKRRPMGS